MTHLGFILTDSQRSLPQERKEAIYRLAPPKLEGNSGVFWGVARFCHIWIPN